MPFTENELKPVTRHFYSYFLLSRNSGILVTFVEDTINDTAGCKCNSISSTVMEVIIVIAACVCNAERSAWLHREKN